MGLRNIFCCVVICIVWLTAGSAALATKSISLPVHFEENLGQWPENIKFAARNSAAGYIEFMDNRINFSTGLFMKFVGSKNNPLIYGANQTGGNSNYYVGDSLHWAQKVRHYQSIVYQGIYSGVDAVFHPGNNRVLEYDFIIQPGVDPAQIVMELHGNQNIGFNSDGDILLPTKRGKIMFKKPISYQVGESGISLVESQFRVLDGHRIAFSVGNYDKNRELIIDPTASLLDTSTVLGGSGYDIPLSIDYNESQALLVMGGVTTSPSGSNGYYTTGSNQSPVGTPGGNTDGFVTVVQTSGGYPTSISYSTYIGGSGRDAVTAVLMDNNGNIYAAGYTNSSNFCFTPDGFDGFVVKLSLSGSTYSQGYCTKISGSSGSFETVADIALDTAASSPGCSTSACVAFVGTTTKTDAAGNTLYGFLDSSGNINTLNELGVNGGRDEGLGVGLIQGSGGSLPTPVIAGIVQTSGQWNTGGGGTMSQSTTVTGIQNVYVAVLSSTGLLSGTNTSGNWIQTVLTTGGIQAFGGIGFPSAAEGETPPGTTSFVVVGSANVAPTTNFNPGSSGTGIDVTTGGYDIFAAEFETVTGVVTYGLKYGIYFGGSGDDVMFGNHSLVVDTADPTGTSTIGITGMTSPSGYILTSGTATNTNTSTGFGNCQSGGTNAFAINLTFDGSGDLTNNWSLCLSSSTSTTTSTSIKLLQGVAESVRDLGTAITEFPGAGHTYIIGVTESYITSGTSVTGGFPVTGFFDGLISSSNITSGAAIDGFFVDFTY